MKILEVKNEENWPKLLNFAQSWVWGVIANTEGLKVDRLSIENDGETVAVQIIYKKLPLGWIYAWCPKGPVFEQPNSQVFVALADYLKKKKCVFLRCEPSQLPEKWRARKIADVNPSTTVILDLNKGEDDLLKEMKKNTRYSIRFAEKQNLVIKNEKNLEIFWNLLQATAKRDKFTTHTKKHYEHILEQSTVWQLTTYKNDEPIASAIFIGAGDTITYLFAASDYQQHQLLAPYQIQWEAIKQSKKMGYKYYDFFGIAPGSMNNSEYQYDRKHHYAGITKYKLGFGGSIKTRPGTYDLVLDQKRYWIYKILRLIYGVRKIGR